MAPNLPMTENAYMTISSIFNDISKELETFNQTFDKWTFEKQNFLISDKEAYIKTLYEEHEAIEDLKKQYVQLVNKRQHIIAGMISLF